MKILTENNDTKKLDKQSKVHWRKIFLRRAYAKQMLSERI